MTTIAGVTVADAPHHGDREINRLVNNHIDARKRTYGSSSRPGAQQQAAMIGRFQNVAGAVVEVIMRLDMDTSVKATAVALCTGFGCVDPVHEVPAGDWMLGGGCDIPEQTRRYGLTAHRWAQTHAEICRAVAAPEATR